LQGAKKNLTAYPPKIVALRILLILFIIKIHSKNAKKNLLLAIKIFGSAKVKKELDQFIHVEFTSNIFKFIDDVKFYLTEQGVIRFRSASRVRHSDSGINRRRAQIIRIAFNKINKNKENQN
jgi:uncharacterized protein (DUF1499 family)